MLINSGQRQNIDVDARNIREEQAEPSFQVYINKFLAWNIENNPELASARI